MERSGQDRWYRCELIMYIARPVIAIIDDYEGFVPALDAYGMLKEALSNADIRVITRQPLDDVAIRQMRDVEYLVLIRERSPITAQLLDRLPALKALVQTGTAGQAATSHIDQDACAQRGIAILEGGASDGHSAAEITWTLILNASRNVHHYMTSMKEGSWQQGNPTGQIGRCLRGQTLGILGYGRIGQLLGGYAKAFGMDVLVWGRENTRLAAQKTGARLADGRDALFEQSDILALQMRMSAESRHSVTLRDLGLMKPTSLLVNTGRPGLIEPGALVAALKAGRPGRVAVDVHDHEPVLHATELTESPRCTATPHIGYVERNSYEILFDAAFRKLIAFLNKAEAEQLTRIAGRQPE